MDSAEIIYSIQWYVEAKNLSLSNALSIMCPLTPSKQNEHRIYYSQYFSSLLSITELLLDNSTPDREAFREELYKSLGSDFDSGKRFYDYLRELRNSIIHRGENIVAAAHNVGNFPMVLSPNPITNRSGNKSYEAPYKYLIDIIRYCESVIPKLVVEHIKTNSWDVISFDPELHLEKTSNAISNSDAMPEWVKQQALISIKEIDFENLIKQKIESALQIIETIVEVPEFA